MSDSSTGGVRSVVRFLNVSFACEVGVLLCLSVMFPFLIHIIPVPADSKLGPRLLPMFYAPLLAVLLGRSRLAVLLAFAAPWLNRALTSYPALPSAAVMMVELLGFVFVFQFMMAEVGARWFLAVPAYFSGKIAAVTVGVFFPELIGRGNAGAWAAQSVVTAAPGIAILVLINWLVLRYYPPGPEGGGSVSA